MTILLSSLIPWEPISLRLIQVLTLKFRRGRLILRARVDKLKNQNNRMLGTVLNCYRLMEKLSLSFNLKIERNTGLEQSIKTSLLETDSQLTEAESMLHEFIQQPQNASPEDKLMVRSR